MAVPNKGANARWSKVSHPDIGVSIFGDDPSELRQLISWHERC